MEEYHIFNHHQRETGTTHYDYFIRLTSVGEQYYRENWQRYRELYPGVEAPGPEET